MKAKSLREFILKEVERLNPPDKKPLTKLLDRLKKEANDKELQKVCR